MPHAVDVMVGKRVRLRRLQLSLSQTDLATKLGLTFQQVQKYEKGTNRISCSRLYEIAAILKVPITFFFSDKVDGRTEVKVAEQLEPKQLKDGLRLITAFGAIHNVTMRRKLLSLVESMAAGEKR
jgi:transcriptional regulator with XRE-family HTH domain